MNSKRSPKPQISLVLPKGIKESLNQASKRLGCSQGEFVRIAIVEYLRSLSLLTEKVIGNENAGPDNKATLRSS